MVRTGVHKANRAGTLLTRKQPDGAQWRNRGIREKCFVLGVDHAAHNRQHQSCYPRHLFETPCVVWCQLDDEDVCGLRSIEHSLFLAKQTNSRGGTSGRAQTGGNDRLS